MLFQWFCWHDVSRCTICMSPCLNGHDHPLAWDERVIPHRICEWMNQIFMLLFNVIFRYGCLMDGYGTGNISDCGGRGDIAAATASAPRRLAPERGYQLCVPRRRIWDIRRRLEGMPGKEEGMTLSSPDRLSNFLKALQKRKQWGPKEVILTLRQNYHFGKGDSFWAL